MILDCQRNYHANYHVVSLFLNLYLNLSPFCYKELWVFTFYRISHTAHTILIHARKAHASSPVMHWFFFKLNSVGFKAATLIQETFADQLQFKKNIGQHFEDAITLADPAPLLKVFQTSRSTMSPFALWNQRPQISG